MTHQTVRGRNPIEQNTEYIPSRLNISSELILQFALFALNQALVAQKVDNAIHQAPVSFPKVDNAIHQKNPSPLFGGISFSHTNLLDNVLSGG